MTFVDAIIVAILLGAAWSGFRRGLISTTVSLIGALGGAVVAIRLAPLAMEHVTDTAAKVAIGIACIVLGVGIGELAGSTLGRALSDRITWQPARTVDRGLGLVGHTIAVLVIVWMVALPLASVPYPWLASSIRSSSVLSAVNRVMPAGVRDISDRMRQLFNDSGFPAILDPLAPTPDTQVAAPDPAAARTPEVVTASRSVVRVRGRADSCARSIEGSGFVIGPGKVLTNAHVVAGTSSVTVEDAGRTLRATVVVYDADRDLAVLAVTGLSRPALVFDGDPAPAGTSAVAAGFPLDGPFLLTAGRIRSEISLRGPNIYNTATVTRDVYTLRADIRAGNSGGPLLGTDGRVLGVVFGAAIDKPDVGFALTAKEVAPVVAAGLVDQIPAPTGACTTG